MTRPALAFLPGESRPVAVEHERDLSFCGSRRLAGPPTGSPGAGCFIDDTAAGVWVEAPRRLSDWTAAATVDCASADNIARAELALRGARGRLRIVATPDEHYIVSELTLAVHVGTCRATLHLDAAVHYPLPAPILVAVADRVSRPTKKLVYAVQHAHDDAS